MIRIATVTRTDSQGVYVIIYDIDPELEWGPLEALKTPTYPGNYAAGKRVLVGNLGSIADDYIVIGPIMETY